MSGVVVGVDGSAASERALAIARARGSLLGQGAGLGWRGLLQLLAGDLAQAELDAQAARAILSGVGLHAQEPASAVTIALALIERGALLLIQVDDRLGPRADGPLRHPGGDGDRWRSGAALPWRSLAGEALLMSGEKAAAARLADADLAAALAFGASRDIGVARRSQARAAGGSDGAGRRRA